MFCRLEIIPYLCSTNMKQKEPAERRTAFVVVFTFIVMVAELGVGLLSHSMALTADGVHMGSHVLVLGLNWGAYVLVGRLRKTGNERYSRDRILSLSAWTSGLFLLLMAAFIIVEAVERLAEPGITIATGQALAVALVGLVANLVCATALHGHTGDLNSRAAYLHILADVLTEVGVIAGLVCAKLWGITFIDTLVALVAAIVVARWAAKLLKATGKALSSAH